MTHQPEGHCHECGAPDDDIDEDGHCFDCAVALEPIIGIDDTCLLCDARASIHVGLCISCVTDLDNDPDAADLPW